MNRGVEVTEVMNAAQALIAAARRALRRLATESDPRDAAIVEGLNRAIGDAEKAIDEALQRSMKAAQKREGIRELARQVRSA